MKKFLLASCVCALLASCGTGASARTTEVKPEATVATGGSRYGQLVEGRYIADGDREASDFEGTGKFVVSTEAMWPPKNMVVPGTGGLQKDGAAETAMTGTFMDEFSAEADVMAIVKDHPGLRLGSALTGQTYSLYVLRPSMADGCETFSEEKCFYVIKNNVNGGITVLENDGKNLGKETYFFGDALSLHPKSWLDDDIFVDINSSGVACSQWSIAALVDLKKHSYRKFTYVDDSPVASADCDHGGQNEIVFSDEGAGSREYWIETWGNSARIRKFTSKKASFELVGCQQDEDGKKIRAKNGACPDFSKGTARPTHLDPAILGEIDCVTSPPNVEAAIHGVTATCPDGRRLSFDIKTEKSVISDK